MTMPMPASIRVRLTLWYVLLLGVILAAFGAGVFLVLRHTLYNNLDASIHDQSSTLSDLIQYQGDRPYLVTRVSPGGGHDGEQFARVYDATGLLTFDNSSEMGEVPVNEDALALALQGTTNTYRVRVDDDTIRVRALPIRRDGRITGVLEIGFEDDVSDTLATLLLIGIISYPLTLVVAGFGGAFLARRALAPIDELTLLARRISAEDLGQRLDLKLPDDEVGRLARTFDEMIARLDEAFHRQRQFTADASHEFRTPLTIVRGQIDVALQNEREPEDYRQVLRAINEEMDRLTRMAGSLLTLARADAGQIPLVLESVRLADVVNGALEQVAQMAGQRGVQLHSDPGPPVTLQPDEDLLLQLLLNLLDNAIKYTGDGGQVTAGWISDGDHVALRVQDTGIGIPEEHIPYVLTGSTGWTGHEAARRAARAWDWRYAVGSRRRMEAPYPSKALQVRAQPSRSDCRLTVKQILTQSSSSLHVGVLG